MLQKTREKDSVREKKRKRRKKINYSTSREDQDRSFHDERENAALVSPGLSDSLDPLFLKDNDA